MSDLQTFAQVCQACNNSKVISHRLAETAQFPALTPFEFLAEAHKANKILIQIHRTIFTTLTPAQQSYIDAVQHLLFSFLLRTHYFTNIPPPTDLVDPNTSALTSTTTRTYSTRPPNPNYPRPTYQQQQYSHQQTRYPVRQPFAFKKPHITQKPTTILARPVPQTNDQTLPTTTTTA